jgi:hypothetical protein
MQCISTPLSEEQLLAAISDVAEANVLEHLGKCDFCQARLAELEHFEKKLRRKLHRWDCPDADVLGEFALNMLPEAEQTRIAEHINTCPVCRKDLAELRQFWEQMDRAEAHDHEIISQYKPQSGKSKSSRRSIMGVSTPRMQGVTTMRGESGGLQTFELDNLRLRVSAVQEQGYYELKGQLSGQDVTLWRNGLVKAQQGDIRPVISIVNNRDQFQCRLPTAGDVILTITAQNGMTIVVEGIKIDPG